MIPVLITARTGSTRLPEKHFLKLGNLTVIEHVVRRCEHFGFRPILCVPTDDAERFKGLCEMYWGDPDNVEVRISMAALKFAIRKFHHLDGDDPFFSPWAIRDTFDQRYARIHPSPQSCAGQAIMGASYNLEGEGEDTARDLYNAPWPQRLTLDYIEDYHLLLAVNRMVGGYMAPRWVVDELFVKNPDLHKINWFRTEEWKSRQLKENKV